MRILSQVAYPFIHLSIHPSIDSFIHTSTEHQPYRYWPSCPVFSFWKTKQICPTQACFVPTAVDTQTRLLVRLFHPLEMQLWIQNRHLTLQNQSLQKIHRGGTEDSGDDSSFLPFQDCSLCQGLSVQTLESPCLCLQKPC